jgi:uncharacterized OB-fold protein
MSELVFDQKIDLPYVYTAGPVQRAALTGFKEGRLVGSEGDGYVAVPATPFGPDGRHLRDTRDLPATGVIEAVTTAHHLDGAPVYALVRIDGASEPLLHLLDGPTAIGARVTAVWRDDRAGSITDIDHFRAAT